jgi:hypothetical protein
MLDLSHLLSFSFQYFFSNFIMCFSSSHYQYGFTSWSTFHLRPWLSFASSATLDHIVVDKMCSLCCHHPPPLRIFLMIISFHHHIFHSCSFHLKRSFIFHVRLMLA